jgi:hypothetical protein
MAQVREQVALLRKENPPRQFHVPLHKYVDKVRRRGN